MTTCKLYLIIISLTIFGCEQKTREHQKQPKKVVGKPLLKKEIDLKYNKIIISYYDNYVPPSSSYKNYGPFSTTKIYEATNEQQFNEFEQILKESKRTGYCCCPKRNYTISFYDKTNNYENYFVDTLEFKDKVRIYQSSFQFSYFVDKKRWSAFLNQLNAISFNEYNIYDLNLARKVYDFTLKNDLTVITSNRVSKQWMYFDGDFKVKISTVGEKLEEDKIYKNIKNVYPNDKYKIETISHYQMCGSYDGHDCYEEYILQIFCNKSFYDKFDIYTPKSFYDKANAEFYVLGSREELNKIDNLAKKEE